MGHTTLGIRLAEDLFPGQSVYLAFKKAALDAVPKSTKIWMETVNSPNRLVDRDLKLVVVDCAGLVSQEKLDRVLRVTSPCDPVFVLLQ